MCWRPGRWPLAARLTAWFAAAVVALYVGAVAAAYAAVMGTEERDLDADVPALVARVHARRALAIAYAEQEEPADDESLMRMVDPAGRVAYEPRRMAAEFPPAVFPAAGGRADRAAPDGRQFTLFTVRRDGWTYQFAVNRANNDRVFRLVWGTVGVVAVPTVGLALGVGYGVAWAGLRPLRRVSAAVRRVGPDRLDRRVPADRLPPELGELAGAFNRALDRVEAAFARVDQFAADVAHEVRTPVHNLRTAAELALRADDGSADGHRRALADVVDQADRLARLVDRLLVLARVSDPTARPAAASSVDVAAELAAVRDFFEPAAAAAGVAIHVAARPGLLHPVDRPLFQRAVSNLVANALAATPAGGRVDLRATAATGELTVEVADTGRGIPADALPRLFDRYYRPPGADTGSGLGLGLAIVKRVAELHGGTAAVASAVGVGTTVRLTFPGRPGG